MQTYAAPVELYAGFWRRVGAFIIDWLIVFIPLNIILAPVGGGVVESSQNGGHGLIRFIVFGAYYVLLVSSSYQATLGQMALGIKVTDIEGNKLTLGRAIGRYFAMFLAFVICFIGVIMAAFTERKQGLHDLIASTLVVRKDAAFATAGGYGAPSPYGAPPPPPPPIAPSSGFAGAAPPPAPETAPPPAPANPDIPASESGQPPADAPGETPPENPPTA